MLHGRSCLLQCMLLDKSSFFPLQVCSLLPQVLGDFSPRLATSFRPSTEHFSGLWTTSQTSLRPAAPPAHQHLLLAEKVFPIPLQDKCILWGNFLWTPCPQTSFLPLGHSLGGSLAQRGSCISRFWAASLSHTTLRWGDTPTHAGLSRVSMRQESSHTMMRHCLSLMSPLCSFWHLPLWPYPVFPLPPHLCLPSHFSPQSHRRIGSVADPSSPCPCPTFSLQTPSICLCIQSPALSCLSPIPWPSTPRLISAFNMMLMWYDPSSLTGHKREKQRPQRKKQNLVKYLGVGL